MFDVQKVSKAIAGALVALFIGYLAKHGVTISDEINGALATIIDAIVVLVIGFIGVYFAPKNRD